MGCVRYILHIRYVSLCPRSLTAVTVLGRSHRSRGSNDRFASLSRALARYHSMYSSTIKKLHIQAIVKSFRYRRMNLSLTTHHCCVRSMGGTARSQATNQEEGRPRWLAGTLCAKGVPCSSCCTGWAKLNTREVLDCQGGAPDQGPSLARRLSRVPCTAQTAPCTTQVYHVPRRVYHVPHSTVKPATQNSYKQLKT